MREARQSVAVVGATLLVLAAVLAIGLLRDPSKGSADADSLVAAVPSTTATVAPAGVVNPGSVPTDGTAPAEDLAIALDGDCTIEATRLALGDSGVDVQCLQQGLITAGFLDGAITGQFDQATYAAVEDLQTERQLFVDGIVGRETAISVGVWPDEAALVIRTPPPAPGATDSMGFPLSSVSSVGADAPPVPADSGSGRRIVYERAGQRVWAIDSDNQVIRSWLITGSKYGNEQPGFHEVYSRSEQSTAWNGKAILPLMVRYQKTDIGAIGFHGIPLHVEDGSPYQTEAELGTRLSGGCQRQANPDAAFMWDFAQVGTTVVVI
ncbi:MAG: L,D-transpeptidase family protein [Ilumatobacteraceae bacterium]